VRAKLEALAQAAKEAGAQWIASRRPFPHALIRQNNSLPFLKEKFPRLTRQYDSWYSRNAYAPEPYRQKNRCSSGRTSNPV